MYRIFNNEVPDNWANSICDKGQQMQLKAPEEMY